MAPLRSMCVSAVAYCLISSSLLQDTRAVEAASGFLQKAPAEASPGTSEFLLRFRGPAGRGPGDLLLRDLRTEFQGGYPLGGEERVAHFEDSLRPTFLALPRSPTGYLGLSGTRYALHRFFVQRHGWFVRGLDIAGEGWNASSPADVLEGRVPPSVWSLFNSRLESRGLSLHETALFALVIESLAHAEAAGRLQSAYQTLGHESESATLNRSGAEEVTEIYMASYILGEDLSAMSAGELQEKRETMPEVYPGWPKAQSFLHNITAEVAGDRDSFTLADVTSVVEEIGDRYGRWQDYECRDLKRELLALEDDGTGRVSLSRFYSGSVDGGKWQFSESSSYLRQLGALDETDPAEPKVIIPNYVNSPSNCVASSSYYSVCCLDECEELLGHLERSIAAPEASPQEVASLVAALPSATEPANRTLPAGLLERLGDIAATHGDRVPLHGRLFAQWMHHAYPRECPYPHVSGTTSPRRAEDFEAETGLNSIATADETAQFIGTSPRRKASKPIAGRDCGPWHHEEELYVSHQAPMETEPEAKRAPAYIRAFMLIAAAGSVVVTLTRSLRSATSASGLTPAAKIHV